MESSSVIEFDYSSNPALAAIFATKKPGDTLTLEVECIVQESDDKKATAAVKSVCDCSEDSMEEDDVEPNSTSPVMMVFKSDKTSK